LIAYRNRNAIARTQNSYVHSSSEPLSLLFNIHTGKPVTGFPNTPAALKRMDSHALNQFLTELGLVIVGTVAEKREMARAVLGLVERPTEPA
jgi:hypothetical protein